MIQVETTYSNTCVAPTKPITVSSNGKKQTIKCKICYSEGTAENQLSQYCSCSQKYCYYHQNCIESYLENKMNRQIQIEAEYQSILVCDKCLDCFKVNYSLIRKCSKKQIIKKTIDRKGFLFGVCFIGLIISIIILAACSVILSKKSIYGQNSIPLAQQQILICFIIFSSLLMLFFVYKLVDKFFTIRKVRVYT